MNDTEYDYIYEVLCFSMQLACDVQIPAVFGGLDSEAVYIDTERTLIINRLKDIVNSTVQHCHDIASSENDEGNASFCFSSGLGPVPST